MNFAAPLGLGIVGFDEVMEVDLVDEIAPDTLLDALNAHRVPGLTFTTAEALPIHAKKAQAQELVYRVAVPHLENASINERIAAFLAADAWVIERDGKFVDVRPLVHSLLLSGDTVSMRLAVINEAGVRPRDVLEVLGIKPDEIAELELERTSVELRA